jgi:hypothetical protein
MLGNRHYNDAWQKVNHLPASRDFRFLAEFSHLAKKFKMAKINIYFIFYSPFCFGFSFLVEKLRDFSVGF